MTDHEVVCTFMEPKPPTAAKSSTTQAAAPECACRKLLASLTTRTSGSTGCIWIGAVVKEVELKNALELCPLERESERIIEEYIDQNSVTCDCCNHIMIDVTAIDVGARSHCIAGDPEGEGSACAHGMQADREREREESARLRAQLSDTRAELHRVLEMNLSAALKAESAEARVTELEQERDELSGLCDENGKRLSLALLIEKFRCQERERDQLRARVSELERELRDAKSEALHGVLAEQQINQELREELVRRDAQKLLLDTMRGVAEEDLAEAVRVLEPFAEMEADFAAAHGFRSEHKAAAAFVARNKSKKPPCQKP